MDILEKLALVCGSVDEGHTKELKGRRVYGCAISKLDGAIQPGYHIEILPTDAAVLEICIGENWKRMSAKRRKSFHRELIITARKLNRDAINRGHLELWIRRNGNPMALFCRILDSFSPAPLNSGRPFARPRLVRPPKAKRKTVSNFV